MARMTASQRERAARAKEGKALINNNNYSMIRHDLGNSEEFFQLSFKAKALLMDFIVRYNRLNNGDLSAAWSDMQKRGWASETTLRAALKELLDAEFLIVTRQGGKNKTCSLYALTCFPINDIRDKNGYLKINVGQTRSAPDLWKKSKTKAP